MDITELIKRATEGDENAFSALVKLTEGSVYRYVYTLVKHREDALDLCQETYLKLWRTLHSYRGECSPTTWILRIAKNCTIDYLRKKRKTDILSLTVADKTSEEQNMALQDTELSPQQAFARKEMQDAIRQAIFSLAEEQRDVLVLREYERLSYEEIAKRLSLEVGTVKSRLNRARNTIKEFLISRNFL